MASQDYDAIAGGPTEQTQSLRAPSLEPSLDPRDTLGAQNRSPSRKRPRLDSGSRTARSESADRALSSLDKAVGDESDTTIMDVDNAMATPEPDDAVPSVPAATPSRVTINVREPPKEGAPASTNGRHDEDDSGPRPTKSSYSMNGHATTGEHSTQKTTPPRSPSPVIEVTDAQSDASEDAVLVYDDEEVKLTLDVKINSHFRSFPYAADGGYSEAADLIAQGYEI